MTAGTSLRHIQLSHVCRRDQSLRRIAAETTLVQVRTSCFVPPSLRTDMRLSLGSRSVCALPLLAGSLWPLSRCLAVALDVVAALHTNLVQVRSQSSARPCDVDSRACRRRRSFWPVRHHQRPCRWRMRLLCLCPCGTVAARGQPLVIWPAPRPQQCACRRRVLPIFAISYSSNFESLVKAIEAKLARADQPPPPTRHFGIIRPPPYLSICSTLQFERRVRPYSASHGPSSEPGAPRSVLVSLGPTAKGVTVEADGCGRRLRH